MTHFIRKGLNGLYYFENSNIPYNVDKLSRFYPDETFIVVNDDKDMPYHNVHPRSSVLKSLQVDDQLKIKCPDCGHKNTYVKSSCASCGKKQPVNMFVKSILGEDYQRALVERTVDDVLSGAGRDTYKGAFEAHQTSEVDGKFMKALASGICPRYEV